MESVLFSCQELSASCNKIQYFLTVVMPDILIVLLIILIGFYICLGLILKGIHIGICIFYYFKQKISVQECFIFDETCLYLFIAIFIFMLLIKLRQFCNRKCDICGKPIKDPFSGSHLKSKFHLDALKFKQN